MPLFFTAPGACTRAAGLSAHAAVLDPFIARGRTRQTRSATLRTPSQSPCVQPSPSAQSKSRSASQARSCRSEYSALSAPHTVSCGTLASLAPPSIETLGRLAIVRWLHPEMGDADLLLQASHEGDDLALEAVLLTQVAIDVRHYNGQTALMLAVTAGSTACAVRLLAAGADVNAVDEAGTTALHLAAAMGDLGMLELLCTQPGTDLAPKLDTADKHTPHDVAQLAQMSDAAAFLRRRQGI